MSIENARNLRRNQTEAEKKLWSKLRHRQFHGIKFRRQHSISPYIVDFYAESKKLAIELDGGQHAKKTNIEKDKDRSSALKNMGIHVIRFWNNDVLKNIDGVLEALEKEIDTIPSPSHPTDGPLPLPMGEATKNRIQIGTITTAHGIKGFVKIKPMVDDHTLLNGELFTSEHDDQTLTLTLKNQMKNFWLAEVDDISDRNEAEALRATPLFINEGALPEADEDEFYYSNLIGLSAIDENGAEIGKVIAVENFGASDLLDIKPSGKPSFYLPFTDETVLEIKKDIIIVAIPVGLCE